MSPSLSMIPVSFDVSQNGQGTSLWRIFSGFCRPMLTLKCARLISMVLLRITAIVYPYIIYQSGGFLNIFIKYFAETAQFACGFML